MKIDEHKTKKYGDKRNLIKVQQATSIPMLHWSAHMGWLSNAGPSFCLPPSRISQTCPPAPGSLHQEAPSQSGTEDETDRVPERRTRPSVSS